MLLEWRIAQVRIAAFIGFISIYIYFMSFDTSSLSERNDKAEVYQPVIIRLENVSKIYGSGETMVKALNNINLSLKKGEYCAIMGLRVRENPQR
jgi:putative ABC transport system ATP-binding protein